GAGGGKPCPPALRGWPHGLLALRPGIVAARAAPRPRWRNTLAPDEARLVWLGPDHQSPGAAWLAGVSLGLRPGGAGSGDGPCPRQRIAHPHALSPHRALFRHHP